MSKIENKKLIEISNYKTMGNIFITIMETDAKKNNFIATYVHDKAPNFGRGCAGLGPSEEEAISKLLGVLDELYVEVK